MILPRTDKETGKPYLSYSSITTFQKDPKEFAERYLYGKPFEGNIWTDFGSKVGEALEHGDFSKFSPEEQKVLEATPRLDQFETKITWDLGDFDVIGFIDTNTEDRSHLIDYKTGGPGKDKQYDSEKYFQLAIYAAESRQKGYTVDRAEVVFLERIGNPLKGYPLKLKPVGPLVIPQDISPGRIKALEKDIRWWAEQISAFTAEFYENVSE